MDDRIRASDADREHVASRLREHFADGRLTSDELDERLSGALNAKTYGELRQLMSDLPEPSPVVPRAARRPDPGAPPGMVHRRGPGLLPVMLIALGAVMLLPAGHWLFFGIFQVLLVIWLVAGVGGIVAMSRQDRHHRHHP